jgi:hypothetical protein
VHTVVKDDNIHNLVADIGDPKVCAELAIPMLSVPVFLLNRNATDVFQLGMFET